MGSFGSGIKYRERGNASMLPGATAVVVTLGATVDIDKCRIFTSVKNGLSQDTPYGPYATSISAEVTSTTELTLTTSAAIPTESYQVAAYISWILEEDY